MSASSKFLSVNQRDLVKGLFIAAASAAIGIIQSSLTAGTFNINWQTLLTAVLAAVLSYLAKNFLTNSNDEMMTKEPVKPLNTAAVKTS